MTIKGPPDTQYEGGFFNAVLKFPKDYPNSPPEMRFTSEMWHPNVFPDGKVCISILHQPGFDPLNPQESAAEKWSPVHTVCDQARRAGGGRGDAATSGTSRAIRAPHPAPLGPITPPAPHHPPPAGGEHRPIHHQHAVLAQRRVASQR